MSSVQRRRDIKHAQRESFFLREVCSLLLRIAQDEPRLAGLSVDRVQLSPDGSHCTVFFVTLDGQETSFQELMPLLILYKPSIRSAIAKASSSRCVPQIIFKYALSVAKQRHIEELIDMLKKEGKL